MEYRLFLADENYIFIRGLAERVIKQKQQLEKAYPFYSWIKNTFRAGTTTALITF